MWDAAGHLFTQSKGLLKSPDGGDSHHLLGPAEEHHFYHRAHFAPWQLSPLLVDNEVVVTGTRVILTESRVARLDFKHIGFSSDACASWKQESFDRDVVRGYEAKRVVPKFRQLLLPLLGLVWCTLVLFEMSPNILDIVHDLVILLPIEHTLWLVGGSCRNLPVCKHSLAKPLHLASDAIKRFRPSPQGNSPETWAEAGVRAGYKNKRYERVSFLQPDPSSLATSATFNISEDSRVFSRPPGEDECQSFTPWSDVDGNDCQKYSEPGWLMSCHDLRSLEERTDNLDERRDSDLNLSPREACCSCGGSNVTGRELAISKLASSVFAVLESIDNSREVKSQLPAAIVATVKEAVDNGKDVLESRLLQLSNLVLAQAGRLAGNSKAHLYFERSDEVVPALELLSMLFPSASAVVVARMKMEQDPGMQRQLQQLQDTATRTASYVREGSKGMLEIGPALLSHHMRALSCFWRIYFLVLFCICLAAIAWWFGLHRRPVTYIVLRSHDKYFGPQRQIEMPEVVMPLSFCWVGLRRLILVLRFPVQVEAPRAPMRCAGLLLWLFVQVQGQFEKQRSVVQAPLSAVQRRTASPVDAFGNPVPDSVAIPNIPRAKPPARVTSSAGYLELELVLETVDLQAECEVFRNDADDTEPSISCFKGSCVTLVKLASLKVDARYMFTMHSVRKVTDGVTGQVFEFHGPRSHPITFVTAGLPDWQLAIPETTSLGSIVMRLSWEEPNTGGSAILGYQVEMETNSQPGWQIIYDGQQDPSVKHLVLSNLTYGTTYFYNVYAINAIGRSQPISTAYTVAVPLEKTFFYPLSTDPSISRDPIPDFIIADVPTDLTIRAKNPVTEWFEVDSTHRNYLAAIHDACELNSERTLCLPVPEQHPDYQDHRQRLNQSGSQRRFAVVLMPKRQPKLVSDLRFMHVLGQFQEAGGSGSSLYRLNYTGNKTGIYSLMVYAIFANGLWGQYWDNAWFYGLPVLSKVDETISFEWGHHEVTALAGDHITARWVGFLLGPTTDEYTIYVKADDSVRVWFQGHLVVDYWDSSIPCCPELWTRQLLEKDRFYSIKVEWKEMQGNAQLRLMWGLMPSRCMIIPGANLWRGAPLESAPFRILVHPGPPSTQTSGLLEPLEQLRTGASQRLYLQALDTMSNTVNSTDVQFEAYFYSPSYTNATVPLVFRSTPLMLQRREDHIHDHLHFIDLVLLEPGNYTLELFLKGHGQLASSPIHFLAVQDDIQPQMCTVVGPGSKEFIAGVETNFTLQLRDAFGNAVPHVDGVKVEVDLEFVEEIGPNLTYDDRRLRNLTGGHYATATSITKGESGSYFITYTGLRAGFNLLTIKVNGLVIMGHEEEVIYNPPVQGQNV
ncbi:rsgI3, partial [Symbiodinium sp. CCMP2456]